jgi:hypothetical protein
MTRFWDYGHTPGVIIRPPLASSPSTPSDQEFLASFSVANKVPRAMAPPAEELSAEYPFTLDLRYRNR